MQAGSGRTEKKRSGTAAHPRTRGSSQGCKGLSGSSDAASRHSPGLDGLQDEIGTSFERSGGQTGLGREAVEDATARSDKDTAEDHGRGNADSGLLVLCSVGSKAPRGSCTPAPEQNHRRMVTLSDDPEDAVDEMADRNNREICVASSWYLALSWASSDPERAAEGPNTDGLFNTCEIVAEPFWSSVILMTLRGLSTLKTEKVFRMRVWFRV